MTDNSKDESCQCGAYAGNGNHDVACPLYHNLLCDANRGDRCSCRDAVVTSNPHGERELYDAVNERNVAMYAEIERLTLELSATQAERHRAQAATAEAHQVIARLRAERDSARKTCQEWLAANAPGGWIDRLRLTLTQIALGNPEWKAGSEAIPLARAALSIEADSSALKTTETRIHGPCPQCGTEWTDTRIMTPVPCPTPSGCWVNPDGYCDVCDGATDR